MDNNTPRAEAERWLGISGKLLTARDFLGSKTFALRARESDPTNHLSDQILAVVDTVLAAEKRLPTATHHPDWYSVLQLPRLVRDPELISGHYRRLVMLLDPDRNRLPFADYALRLVIDGWSVLSDPTKKWIFDNELSVYLQSVENHHQFQQQQPPPPPPQQQMINTFQFLQSPATAVSAAVVVEQTSPSPSTAALMWQQLQQQQQQHHHQQQQHHSNENNSFININNNVSQIEFMQAPADMRRTTAPEMRQEVEMLPPQWRVREDAAAAAEGMRRFADVAPVVSNVVNATVVAPVPVVVAETPKVIETGNNNNNNNNDNDGGIRVRVSVLGENNLNNNNINDNSNNNVEDDGIRVSVVEEDEDVVVNEEKDDENVEEVDGENVDGGGGGGGEVVESFWTSCPYCFYTYEYQKMYQECTLRCQNCRRGFHAIKVADPPSIDGGEEGGKEGKNISSFGSWGFFPLGFSKVGWKKSNQVGKSNVASTWMPFSPMFVSPVENGSAGGGADFKWFSSSGAAAVGPKNLGRMPASRPRVYIDEDGFDSGPSESDSSDKDWRRNPAHEKKMTKKRRVSVEQMRKVRASYVRLPSIGPRDIVMGLHAVVNNNAGKKKVASTVGRNPVKRKVKNMGRLDLNVEFNNEGDEHAPAVSAVNGEDDAIENIGFFEGLDEFFSTLPILNVSGEKAKPS